MEKIMIENLKKEYETPVADIILFSKSDKVFTDVSIGEDHEFGDDVDSL